MHVSVAIHLPTACSVCAVSLLQVLISLAAVAAFAFIGIPTIAYYTGLAGVAKYWLMPWLGYHFWMSTFTVVHHTAPHIPFKPASEWNAAKAQLSGELRGAQRSQTHPAVVGRCSEVGGCAACRTASTTVPGSCCFSSSRQCLA